MGRRERRVREPHCAVDEVSSVLVGRWGRGGGVKE